MLESRGGLEEIKAAWMILGVVTTILLFGFVAGIITTVVVVDDDGGKTSPIVLGCLLAGLFTVFTMYFFLMQKLVVDGLRDFTRRIDEYCAEISEQKSNNVVTFRFQMNVNRCRLYWDRDFQCWVEVSTADPIVLSGSTSESGPVSAASQPKESHFEISSTNSSPRS